MTPLGYRFAEVFEQAEKNGKASILLETVLSLAAFNWPEKRFSVASRPPTIPASIEDVIGMRVNGGKDALVGRKAGPWYEFSDAAVATIESVLGVKYPSEHSLHEALVEQVREATPADLPPAPIVERVVRAEPEVVPDTPADDEIPADYMLDEIIYVLKRSVTQPTPAGKARELTAFLEQLKTELVSQG